MLPSTDDRDSILCTDELATYNWFGGKMRRHMRVTHSAGQYAKTESGVRVHVNTAEGGGLIHLATLSDGTRIAHPRLARKAAKRLRRLNRERDRRRKGSVNRRRTVAKLGRAHRALGNTCKDAMRIGCHRATLGRWLRGT